MICEPCLRDDDSSAKYCCACGRGLIGQPDDRVLMTGIWSDRARRCVHCEETIPARSRFCSECGIAVVPVARRDVSSQLLLGAVILGFMVIANCTAYLRCKSFSLKVPPFGSGLF
jgi:hypothetical protein